jgi:hypothetical protein
MFVKTPMLNGVEILSSHMRRLSFRPRASGSPPVLWLADRVSGGTEKSKVVADLGKTDDIETA